MRQPVDAAAVVLCEGRFRTPYGKTAHGLVRGSDRYRVVGVVDSTCAGRDAGELLDGQLRGIPVFASIPDAVEKAAERPYFAVVGVATSGGRFTEELRAALLEAVRAGLTIVNGLHQAASEDPEIAEEARRRGLQILDIRKPQPTEKLRFWTGEALEIPVPRIAVLGTDCAVGKRTTTRLLAQAANEAGIRTEWISTGQTGWMQGAPYGILLDALPNDFVSGELEHAVVSCAREMQPDLILIEGQSSLRNPSGPCGSELILSAGARGVVLQHAAGRPYFEGLEEIGCAIPPLEEEIALIRLLGARTVGVALNTEGLASPESERARDELAGRLGIPVVRPLEEGVGGLLPSIAGFLRDGGR
ncbi:MAG: DUF1611 domain-containing protein [Thermoanaerobaculia bacterium]